jgi:hypothetical protein
VVACKYLEKYISQINKDTIVPNSTLRSILGCITIATLLSISTIYSNAAEFVWLEGELGNANVPVNNSGWGNTSFLSEGVWMHISIDADKIDETVPEEGVVIKHPFKITKPADYEVWGRVGFEFARSDFEWRLDDGEWSKISSEELTTDLMNIAFWCEVAWLKLGNAQLDEGDHMLEIRLQKIKNEKGEFNRILYAGDAFCIHEGKFFPDGKFKPGDGSARSEEDLAAEAFVFELPEAEAGNRSSVSLKGTWQAARHDEQLPGEVASPINELPENPVFRAIAVPGDKNQLRPDLLFAHRIWYRTRISVPETMKERSFFIDFPLNNLNTTVYVNGELCGFEKNPFCRFQIDVTKAVKPGENNEIMVGIRDAWYGYSADPERPMKLRRAFNLPIDILSRGFQDLDYPIWNCPQSGILGTPAFVAAGKVYSSDVFVKPSVADNKLNVEIEVTSAASEDVTFEVTHEAVNPDTGEVEKKFKTRTFNVAAKDTTTIETSDDWDNPRLWWPDEPQLYKLRTIISVGGNTVDVRETPFGFREWRMEGKKFTLNGVVWHMWADVSVGGSNPEQWLESYRRSMQRTARFVTAGQAGHNPNWLGQLEADEALDFFDRSGVVIRRNSTVDGEVIGYQFSENDQETVKKQDGSNAKLTLMKNWLDQCVAQVKGERNHPSIQIWTIENEFAYINLINLLGNSPLMDEYEGKIKEVHDAVMAVDPTRSVMIDGGGALKDNSLEVHGDHYVATLDTRYPDLAYESFPEGGGRGRWLWDEVRPRYLGEDYYAAGIDPGDYAQWGGEAAFRGKSALGESIAICYRMLNEGYRWGEHYAAWHFWVGGDGGTAQWVANAPRAVFTREWNWTFESAESATRTFGVFNDTQYDSPLSFTRKLIVDGKVRYKKTTTHNVAPGENEKFAEDIRIPKVRRRTEAELVLSLEADGKEIFTDTKKVSILPKIKTRGKMSRNSIALYDPRNKTGESLKSLKIPFTSVASLEEIPASAKLLIVGSDALDEECSVSPVLSAFAVEGRSVVVLDQTNPLKHQAFPAEMESASTKGRSFATEGRTAFIEDSSHEVFYGVADKDFFTWKVGAPIYRNAYSKPVRGAKSLLQVGPRLTQTALTEIPVGKGVIYTSQLAIDDNFSNNAAARQMLANIIDGALSYKQISLPVSACINDEWLAENLRVIGLKYDEAANPVESVKNAKNGIAIVSADPENLASLASQMSLLEDFWKRGGSLMLHGLTPEGIDSFNKIVGVEHLIRPFKRERVQFPDARNPLTSGISSGDLTMLSGERIFPWQAGEFVSSDVFTYIVDTDDVAPFATSDFHSYDNIVNGFVGADGWKLIIDFPIPENNEPFEMTIDLPREETLYEITYDQSVNYNPTTKISLENETGDNREFAMEPTGDAQTFAIKPPLAGKNFKLRTMEWHLAPGKSQTQGIDNINLMAERSDNYRKTVKPMLNVGGLVQYVKGNGNVILCNIKFQENEVVPVNRLKKQAIISAVLKNMKASFSVGRTVIAGGGLDCLPIDIHTKATTYKDDKGWFGDNRFTFAALPAGKHKMAGVDFDIYEMPTSPTPQILMLGGHGVPGKLPEKIEGIPVETKADALFFLHTAKIDRRRSEHDIESGKVDTMFKYVVHYADGETAEIPVRSEIDIEHYTQGNPVSLPGALLAWTRLYEGTDTHAAAYSMQWNNPRPDVEISSVDMIPVDVGVGTPALVAITAVTAK